MYLTAVGFVTVAGLFLSPALIFSGGIITVLFWVMCFNIDVAIIVLHKAHTARHYVIIDAWLVHIATS